MFSFNLRKECKVLCVKSLFSALLILFATITYAQPPTDVPIDPNTLKDLSPAALQQLLQDRNKPQHKAGDDLHRKTSDLQQREAKLSRDSMQVAIQRKVLKQEDVWGSDLFQYG